MSHYRAIKHKILAELVLRAADMKIIMLVQHATCSIFHIKYATYSIFHRHCTHYGKVQGANMGPISIKGPQDPRGPHVGPMNLVIWDIIFSISHHVCTKVCSALLCCGYIIRFEWIHVIDGAMFIRIISVALG